MSKGSNPFAAQGDAYTLSEGRKYMLRSASARICVTDTQACARGAILTTTEIEVSTEIHSVYMHFSYHGDIHVPLQLDC